MSTPRYSPSQTARYLECPTKRALTAEGWASRTAGKRELGGVLGTAFAAGMAAWRGGVPNVKEWVGEWTETTARDELASLAADGLLIGAYDQAQADAIPARAARAVEFYTKNDPIPPEWRIVAVEQICDESNARPDLVLDDGRGPAPLDFKVKLQVWGRTSDDRERNRAEWHRGLEYWWQMHHYADALGADHYYICHVEVEPKPRVDLIPHEIHPETARRWRESAAVTWARMAAEDRDEVPTPFAAVHTTRYGDCEYLRACLEHHLDVEKMARDYVRRPRRSP